MANLTLPGSPSDGDTVTHEGTKFTYNGTAGRWTRELLSSRIETVVPSTNTSVTATSVSGNTLVFTQADGSTANVDLSSLSGGQVTTYANESDLPSDADNGSHGYVTATTFLYVKATSGWYKITSVNLTPAVTVSSNTVALSSEAESVDVTYTVAEPEDTPVTISVSNTGISNTDQVTITHHTGNNTLTILAGNTVLSGGSLTVSASDGVNVGTGTISIDLSLGVSWSSYDYYNIVINNTGSAPALASQLYKPRVSNNGLIIGAGQPNQEPSGGLELSGGFQLYENTSGDTSNTTSWSKIVQANGFPVATGQNFSGMTHTLGSVSSDSSYDKFGEAGVAMNANATLVAIPYIATDTRSTNYQNASKVAVFVMNRNVSNNQLTDHSSFNPYHLLTSKPTGSALQFTWRGDTFKYYGFDDNFEYFACTFGYNVNNEGISTAIYSRDTSTNTWSLDKQMLYADYPSTDRYGTSKPSSSLRPALGDDGLAISADGTKIFLNCAQGNATNSANGGFTTILRTGSTWAAEANATVWNGNPYDSQGPNDHFGYRGDMSKDGNYMVVMGNIDTVNSANGNSHKLYLHEWNAANKQWDKIDDIFIRDTAIPYFDPTDGIFEIKMNYDGSLIYVSSWNDDGATDANAGSGIVRIFKREGSTLSFVTHMYGEDTMMNADGITTSTRMGQDVQVNGDGSVWVSAQPGRSRTGISGSSHSTMYGVVTVIQNTG